MEFELLISFLTLAFMEIVLGIDNLVFISISTEKLPESQRPKARTIGIGLALLVRVILLLMIAWIAGLTAPIATINLPEIFNSNSYELSWRDIILFVGGLFLLAKSVTEIHHKIEGHEGGGKTKFSSFSQVIIQIILLDIVFSFDSILTAIGLVPLPSGEITPISIMQYNEFWVMVAAIVLAMIVMLVAAKSVASFISKHPTVNILALSFLLLIGFMLVLEGLHIEVPKGYIYFAIFFSLIIEFLNMRFRKKSQKRVEVGDLEE